MEVVEAWQRIDELRCKQSISKEPITVAIVDWGIQRDHQAFGSKLVTRGVNVIAEGGNVYCDPKHNERHLLPLSLFATTQLRRLRSLARASHPDGR